MDKIDEQLNNLSKAPVPIGVHHTVMRKINSSRLRPVLFVILSLLALNFLVIVWHINAKLINAEFTDMMQDFFDVFNFNFEFIKIFLVSFFEIISPTLVFSAVLSLAGIIYTGKKINLYNLSKA